MDSLCEELDEAKSEIDKLKAGLQHKTELFENLRKAHNDQLIKLKEASAKIERQTRELSERSEETSEVKTTCDGLRCSLNEKESIVRRLADAHDRLRVDCDEKCLKWEEEKRGLVRALDEADEKNVDQEIKIRALKAEIEGLEALLSGSKKKCEEVEMKAKASRELRESEEARFKLREQNRKVEDQLKWKKEQFKHLEEAHEKLQFQYKESKKEWELERSALIDEIESLQTSLDSQARISEDLQKRLQLCNHALAHEESRRKYLEIEVSELRSRFESAVNECDDTQSQLECLTTQRDNEIAALRHSLGTKAMLYKEVEYRAGKLELENQELLASIKELQESQIQEVGNSSSLAKLRNKLRSVEQMHRECSANFRSREAEWSTQIENLTRELDSHRSAVECKEDDLEHLKLELEDCYSVIMQLNTQNVEKSVISTVLKSGIAESELSLRNAKNEMSLRDRERDEHISLLKKELEMKSSALAKVSTDAEKCEKAAALAEKVVYLELVEEEKLMMQKELERCKEMLEESSAHLLCFKKQVSNKEIDLNNTIKALCDALDAANEELALERDKALLLARRIESINEIEEKRLVMQKELEGHKEMLDKSSRHRAFLEEQILQNENVSRQKLKEMNEALELAKMELAEYREKAAFLSDKVDSLVHLEEQQLLMQEELRSCKEKLEESLTNKKLLEEKSSNVETELREKLGEVCYLLDTLKSELAEEREKAASLSRRLESFGILKEEHLASMKEIERYREMLEESSRCRLRFEQQALQKENSYKQKLQEACDALEKVNVDLASKICEGHAVEFELWIWKSIAERLKDELEENQALRKELEASLIAEIEVGETIKEEKDGLFYMLDMRDSRIADLQQQLERRESIVTSSSRPKALMSFESERAKLLQISKEKDRVLEDLRKAVGWLEEESLRRELEVAVFAQIGAERTFGQEKEKLMKLVDEKEHRITKLMQSVALLEEKYNNSLASFSSELAEKQAEIILVHEAWEKIVAAEILMQLEIEEKKLIIEELEGRIYSITQKLESSSSHLREQAQIGADLEAKQLEFKELIDMMEKKLQASKMLVDDFKTENGKLIDAVKMLSIERGSMLDFLGGLSDRMSQVSREDIELMESLERAVKSMDCNRSSMVHEDDCELLEAAKENVNALPSSTTKNIEAILDERSPFRELN